MRKFDQLNKKSLTIISSWWMSKEMPSIIKKNLIKSSNKPFRDLKRPKITSVRSKRSSVKYKKTLNN
jgi:hypothetical protein